MLKDVIMESETIIDKSDATVRVFTYRQVVIIKYMDDSENIYWIPALDHKCELMENARYYIEKFFSENE